MEKACLCCNRRFTAHPAVRNQLYCGDAECQKARRRTWQKEKLANDDVYRQNQASAQQQWQSRNKGYWSEYRKRNPAYTERNRIGQKERNRRKRSRPMIAKMDEHGAEKVITSGRYKLVPVCGAMIANMDELIVEIGVISRGCSAAANGA